MLDEAADACGDCALPVEKVAAYTDTNAIRMTGYLERLRDRARSCQPADRSATGRVLNAS